MNDSIKITLPKLGESIVSATVVQWFKKPGDRVERDEPLLEVSTDKVNSEIPSPVSGFLQEILAHAEQELQVGETLALLSTVIQAPVQAAPLPLESKSLSTCEQLKPTNLANETFLSPAVLRLLQERKIPLADIDKIPHTGQGGRLTKQDVENYNPIKAVAKPQCQSQPVDSLERVKMSGLRKAIAENMVKSFYEAPHASLVTEVDVTQVVQWIAKQKEPFQREHGVKLTITSFVARSLCRALQNYPLLNSSLENDTIVLKRFVNLGIAVSIDQGVMVPVIRNCQALSLPEIAKAVAELAEKARSSTLRPTDVQEGSITMTNFGMTGTMLGIPIIRHPEVAIVGLGAITKKVMAMPDDSIAIRSIMMISLTFDHRVLDGLYGCGFLNDLKKHLQEDRD